MFKRKPSPNHVTLPVDETAQERERAKEKLQEQQQRVRQLEQQADVLRRQHDGR